jgi:pyrimidine deaminase RibD-like protein
MSHQDIEAITLAISEAAKSTSDDPDDPKVGAVLVKEGRIVESAYRGQFDPGNHAEFTLLHKILRSKERTAGATLYTTLEPCTSRSHDKLPCAEWIVQKDIKRVVIGILDPNPTICGRGYWHLVDAGIEVEFFPAALARQVVDLNSSFVQAHRVGAKKPSGLAASAIQRHKSVVVAPYIGTGWGDDLSLQDCPTMREGWPMAKIDVRLFADDPFCLPDRHQQAYEDYFRREYDKKRFKHDGVKFMLSRNPTSFSDSPSLTLQLRPTKYSHVQYYRDNVAIIPSERNALLEELVRGTLEADFPHSFCMHMIVVTSDRKVLLTRRSPKVDYYPGTWSASVEEQLAPTDFEADSKNPVLAWGGRLLLEELGLGPDAYHHDNLRILSVFLESDILNTSLCAYAELKIDSATLEKVIRSQSRTDFEFTEWGFLDLQREALLSELFQPTRQYHATSGIRLMQTFLKNFGMPKDDELHKIGIK